MRNLLLEAPLVGDAILGNQSTLRIRSDSWSKAEADSRFPRRPLLFGGPLRRRRWDFQPHPNAVHAQDHPEPAVPDAALRAAHPGQRQHPPDLLRLLEQGPVRHEVPPRRHLQLPDPVGHGLENSPGVAPTADLTVNSLTRAPCKRPCCRAPRPTSRSGTPPPRRHAAGLLRRRRHRQDVTVRSDRTLNATTADFARSSWAAGTFSSSSSVTATQEIESDLRAIPRRRCAHHPGRHQRGPRG